MTLVEQLRALGLPMGSRYAPWTSTVMDEETGEEVTVTTQTTLGWTTDQTKADAARDLGATVQRVPARSGDPAFDGWEVSVREVVNA